MAQHLTQLGASEHSNNYAQSANLLENNPCKAWRRLLRSTIELDTFDCIDCDNQDECPYSLSLLPRCGVNSFRRRCTKDPPKHFLAPENDTQNTKIGLAFDQMYW